MIDSNTEWDLYFLNLAKDVSLKSKDPSTKTGAVIVRPDHSIVSTGFNGFPRQLPDRPEDYLDRELKYRKIVHCEVNALIFAREDVYNYTLYTYPFLSCERCFVTLLQAGITKFVAPKLPDNLQERWGSQIQTIKEWGMDAEPGLMIIEYDMDEKVIHSLMVSNESYSNGII